MTGAVTATGAELSARFALKVVCTLGCHFWVGGFANDRTGASRSVVARWSGRTGGRGSRRTGRFTSTRILAAARAARFGRR